MATPSAPTTTCKDASLMRSTLRRSLRRALVTGLLVALPLATFTSLALADDIYNSLDNSIDATVEVMSLTVGGSPGSTTYKVQLQDKAIDGENNCNFNGSSEALTVSVASSNAAAATVSPSSITFRSCDDVPTVTVTPVAARMGAGSVTARTPTACG
jgi:hypothetical protein